MIVLYTNSKLDYDFIFLNNEYWIMFFPEYEETDNIDKIKTKSDITKIYLKNNKKICHVIGQFCSCFINNLNEAS